MSGGAIEYRRLRAPTENGSTYSDPPLDSAPDCVCVNRERACRYQYDLQGREIAELARQARRELIQAARRYTSAYRELPGDKSAEQEAEELIKIANMASEKRHAYGTDEDGPAV